MSSNDLVLHLLRSALWGEKVSSLACSDGQWEEVYEIAVSQGVQTLIFDAFHPGCVPPRHILARWTLDVERAEKVFSKIESVQDELSARWKSAGIRYAVLKGLSLARLYPHPEHRLAGDIDFYFPEREGFEKANKAARRLSNVSMDSDGDIHYIWKGTTIEHHHSWNHLSSSSAADITAVIKDGMLCPEDTLLMIVGHILRHAMVGGVGLRQLADLAVATRAYDGICDKASLALRLGDLGLGRWAAMLSSVMNASFGVPAEMLPVAPDGTYADEFMSLVNNDGNLGHCNDGILPALIRRVRLFMKICPGELCARLWSLATGRARRTWANRKY